MGNSKVKQRPKYLLHKATGQARVRISGRDFYLGKYGSEDSRQLYDDLIGKWLADQDPQGLRLTLDDLCLLYIGHCDMYYRKPDGRQTGEAGNIRAALRPLLALFGTTRARDFSPRRLKEYREKLIANGICRSSCNRSVTRVRGMFRWAVENEYLPVETWNALKVVQGLRRGRSDARETDPVKPVSQAFIDAIKPYVSRQIWACIQLQLLTGARPGEILSMRGCDLNTRGKVWEYVPASHKTEHYGHHRVIFLGPQSQEIIHAFLRQELTSFLFRPRDARSEWLAQFNGPGRPDKKGTTTRQAGERYTTATYAEAVRRGCEKAFDMPAELRRINPKLALGERERLSKEAARWRAEFTWHPHQLRHNAATRLRREHGLDAARAILGHASMVATEVYAEIDQARARDVIGLVG